MPKIVLDAGHASGYNRSPVFTAYKEGDMTWALYGYLRDALIKKGFEVSGTRGNPSKDIPVYDRGQMAKGTDLFLSLHSNAVGDPSVTRVVVIPPYLDKNGTYDLANRLGAEVTEVMGIGQRYQIYTRTYTDNAGKTRDYYGVIRGAVDAGCKRSLIVEHGFHTNEYCARWLYNRVNLKRLADREAAVIAEYFGIWKAKEAKKEYEVGNLYVMRADDIYSDGRPVSRFTVGQTYTVKRVLPERILLAEINSWVMTG